MMNPEREPPRQVSPAWRLLSAALKVERVHLITGGLGNQMFQHAYAMALHSADGAAAAIDASRCGRNSVYVGYEIDKVFNLEGSLPTLSWTSSQLLYRFARRCGDVVSDHGDVSFDEKFLAAGRRGYVQGFFPSYRYFLGAEDRVRRAFQFRNALPESAAKLAQILADGDTVAVHVRRGDYLTGNHAKTFMGVCTSSYYQTAIKHMIRIRPKARFFFFSDDPEWCRREFSEVATLVVDGNPRESAWVDMALMSRCRNAIIANSSFSWWGRWIGGYEDAVCIGPSRLMNSTGTRTSIEDFLQPCFTLIDDQGHVIRPAHA